MNGSSGSDGLADGSGEPSVSAGVDVVDADGVPAAGETEDALAPSEAFQTLASEVRVTVLVELLAAERAGDDPLTFSTLQSAADADSSAGFAYHLRQLTDHFVRQREDGYVLTPAGRRAAEAVAEGTFTGGGGRAS